MSSSEEMSENKKQGNKNSVTASKRKQSRLLDQQLKRLRSQNIQQKLAWTGVSSAGKGGLVRSVSATA